jgi:hypothetical protein
MASRFETSLSKLINFLDFFAIKLTKYFLTDHNFQVNLLAFGVRKFPNLLFIFLYEKPF